MSRNRLDVSHHLADPLVVSTECSWRRILASSGKPICVPVNSIGDGDNHPDLQVDMDDLYLFAASPELYESNIMLLDALEKALIGKQIKGCDEIVEFAKLALTKAEARA
jgi:hypothetical protein